MDTDTTTSTPSVAEAIRTATWRWHEQAEANGFLGALTSGALGVEGHADLTVQLWAVYSRLEAIGIEWAADPVVGGFVDERLDRRDALEADLRFLVGDDWPARVDLLPATRAYLERLDTAASADAGAFVAHHYTRYMGDMSGGQMIAAMLRQNLGLDGDGLRFYAFDGIDSLKRYKDAYRQRLDATGWTARQVEAVTDEVVEAYRLNAAVFDGLAQRHLRAT